MNSTTEITSNMNSPIAVIDIGSTSVRMVIAEIGADEKLRILESLQQALSLGKDTFTKGYIEKYSTEECVKSLKIFKKVLEEYQILNSNRIKAIATSAVREATNRDSFINRIYIGTGITVDAIGETDVNRFMYLSIQKHLKEIPALSVGSTLIIEVGGGSTQVLILNNGRVAYSNAFRFGSFRIHEILEHSHTSTAKFREIIENQIQNMIEQIKLHISLNVKPKMIILGGDARFTATQIIPDWNKVNLVNIPILKFKKFTNDLLEYSIDEIVKKYHQAYPDAESIGPALLTYLKIAETFKIQNINITSNTVRDGALIEMTSPTLWTDDFKKQILNNAVELGKKYNVDQIHADNVADLSQKIFQAIQNEHKLGPHFESILIVASLLHEVGLYISNTSYHKHSQYIIQNSELFGFGANDIQLTALIARYHRRAQPSINHEEYNILDNDSRIIVIKLAAIIRIADAIARRHGQLSLKVSIDVEENTLVLTAINADELTLEQVSLKDKSIMFEQVFGMNVLLRKGQI